MNNNGKTIIRLKPYTLKELENLYGVCGVTIKKWLVPFQNEIGVKNGRFYSIPQVAQIFKKLGYPIDIEV